MGNSSGLKGINLSKILYLSASNNHHQLTSDMKKLNIFKGSAFIALLLLTIHLTGQDPAPMEYIYVQGNQFVKESGEPIIFRGVNIRDPHNLAEEGRWTFAHFEKAKEWGSNVIRLPVHPASWRERGQEEYLKLIDQAVEWARQLGIYLILDWHSIGNLKEEKFQSKGYVTTIKETNAFWFAVSKRYSREPVVAMYELYNEPTVSGDRFGEMTWAEWKEINEQFIRTIRVNHEAAVILVAGFDWAYELRHVKDDPIQAQGIAYVSHPYPQKVKPPWEPKWQEDWGYVADKYPVILTEIGFAVPGERGLHVPVEGDETYGNALVDYAYERGISWVVWCFDPRWSPLMFTDWDYTPTRQGEFFRNVMTGNQ
jgi:aryl-phospho-beta-D-glucosidase BglC (GH1 family)